jgi:hypothetical protein
MRTCAQCQRIFKPSSGHLRCPACRSIVPCECGRPKQRHSRTCAVCRPVGGINNGNWKGGQIRHKAGYVMIRQLDHPRAPSNGGYVFEHILVLERRLGRLLTTGESVHHLNGVKDDNRPENLELWTGKHPVGIRASDAVAWAVEILRRYEPAALSGGYLEARGLEPLSETASHETSTSVDRI